jgi:hypothetical protein
MIRGHRALRGAKAGGSEMRRGRYVFFCTNRDIETKTLQKTNISIALPRKQRAKRRGKRKYIELKSTETRKSISCMTLVEIFDLVSTHVCSVLDKVARTQAAKGSEHMFDDIFHRFHEPLAWNGVHRKQEYTILRNRGRGGRSSDSIEVGDFFATGREDAPSRAS